MQKQEERTLSKDALSCNIIEHYIQYRDTHSVSFQGTMSNDQSAFACIAASLILTDSKQEITQPAIKKIIAAAGIKDLDEKWPILFSRFLAGKDVMSLLTTVSVGGCGCDAGAAAGAESAAAPAEEKAKKE